MASTLKGSLIHWRKKLERTIDEDSILNTIHKLSKVPITVELLQDTGIGKIVRSLAKKSGKVGSKASSVLQNWREVVASNAKSPESSPKLESLKHNSQKRDNSCGEKTSDKSHKQSVHEKHRKLKPSHDSTLKQKHASDSSNHSSSKLKLGASSFPSNGIDEKGGNRFDFNSASDRNVESRVVTSGCHEKRKADNLFQNDKSDAKKRKREYTETCDASDEKKHKKEFSSPSNCLPNEKKHKKEFTLSSNGVSEDGKPKHDSHHLNGTHDQRKHKHDVAQISASNSRSKIEAVQKTENSTSKKKDKEKSHKSRNHKDTEKSHSKKNKETKKKASSKLNACLNLEPTEAFTSSEVRFEDCLSFNDIVPVRKKKLSKSTSGKKGKCALKKEIGNGAVAPKHKHIAVEKEAIHLSPNLLEPQASCLNGVDIVSTLPQTQPNYRPLPQRSYDDLTLSKKKVLSNEDAIKFTSSRREKTSVYSGRRNVFYTEVPTLVDSCIRVLIENLDSIEYIGGAVPYFIMRQVLIRCSATQLHNIEDFNPYLLDETQELWEIHCKKDFRNHKRQENETWRDLYWRATEERERKLKSITANISASMTNSRPERRVKLAYVDSVVKPPRDVARKQAKHGTALPAKHPVKAGPPSKATPRPVAPVVNSAPSHAASHSREIVPKKPKVAPLMAKTLKSMRQCFRR